ncbi:hypothetical protein KTH_54810 [Thermosporothrix hazakensis]|nr:hypothetical protein KTH_54810 [Thermosporothrix hazakensis]
MILRKGATKNHPIEGGRVGQPFSGVALHDGDILYAEFCQTILRKLDAFGITLY